MKKRLIRVLVINLSLLTIFIVYYVISQKIDIYIPCVFRMITGYKCPGCGITHYLFHLINLDFKSAFFDNPFVFICVPILFIYYLIANYNYVKYDNRNKVVIPRYLSNSLLIIALLFAIARNIWDF